MKAAILNFLSQFPAASRVRELGPYFLLELLVPGGSVLALLLWWHRHRHEAGARHVLCRNR